MTNLTRTSESATAIELLTWSGCPSHDAALEQLTRVLGSLGRAELSTIVRWIESDQEAQAQRFAGSPTYRMAGRELIEVGNGPYGLSCRVYRKRDGRYSPLPDDDDLRDALEFEFEFEASAKHAPQTADMTSNRQPNEGVTHGINA